MVQQKNVKNEIVSKFSEKSKNTIFKALSSKKIPDFFPDLEFRKFFPGHFGAPVGHVCHFYTEKNLVNFKPGAHNNKEPIVSRPLLWPYLTLSWQGNPTLYHPICNAHVWKSRTIAKNAFWKNMMLRERSFTSLKTNYLRLSERL